MLIGGIVYLIATSFYLTIVLSVVYIKLSKKFQNFFKLAFKKPEECEDTSKASEINIETTQISLPKFSYKRSDLRIEIPDYRDTLNDQKLLIFDYFKQNCFPLLLGNQKIMDLKIQQISIWFLTICSEQAICVLITSRPGLIQNRTDFYVLGPIIACFLGIMFSGFYSLIFALRAEGKFYAMVEGIKFFVLFGIWTAGIYISVGIEVRII